MVRIILLSVCLPALVLPLHAQNGEDFSAADVLNELAVWGPTALDLHSTGRAVGMGYQENNRLVGQGFGQQAAVLLGSALAVKLTADWLDQQVPGLGWVPRGIHAFVHSWAAVHNYRLEPKSERWPHLFPAD